MCHVRFWNKKKSTFPLTKCRLRSLFASQTRLLNDTYLGTTEGVDQWSGQVEEKNTEFIFDLSRVWPIIRYNRPFTLLNMTAISRIYCPLFLCCLVHPVPSFQSLTVVLFKTT